MERGRELYERGREMAEEAGRSGRDLYDKGRELAREARAGSGAAASEAPAEPVADEQAEATAG